MTVFNFMSFATQVPVKKSKLKKFSDLHNHLWISLQGLAKRCERIVFDLYHQNSLKEMNEIAEVSKEEWSQMFYMMIQHFLWRWISFGRCNRIYFLFISFSLSGCWRKILVEKQFILEGVTNIKYDQNTCILASITKTKRPLRCCHENTDDRIMYHLSHAVRIQKYDKPISWCSQIYWWNP